ncbi:WYL domain-containing protein [Salmonella enterica]|nr:WYL domain-containing protein [Salmonella enterica]
MFITIEIALIIVCGAVVAMIIGKEKGSGSHLINIAVVAVFFVGLYFVLKSLHTVCAHIFTGFVLFGTLGVFLEKKKKPDSELPDTLATKEHSLPHHRLTSSQYQFISFGYVNSASETTFREVDVKEVNDTYITGYCHLRRQLRTFRIDRIRNQEVVIRDSGEVINVYDWITLLYPLPEV